MRFTVPERFIYTTFDDYRAETPSQVKALEAARRVIDDDDERMDGWLQSLVLAGPTGVGKTHLAAAITDAEARRLKLDYNRRLDEYEAERAERGVSQWVVGKRIVSRPRRPELGGWLNVAQALTHMRLEIGRDERPVTEMVERFHEYEGLLVLDDLGREKVSDWTGELVYSLVNARYEDSLQTIVTTNLTPAELAGSPYWPAISRLAEDGELIHIEGSDHRLKRPTREAQEVVASAS